MPRDSTRKSGMLKLFLIRHAKSSWSNPSLTDFNRPLNKRGRHAAPVMAERLFLESGKPDFIYSSPAQRAKETAFAFCSKLGIAVNQISFKEEIYEAGIKEIISVLENTSNDCKTVWLFGHNPSISYAGNYLDNSWSDHVPTCGIVGLQFQSDNWLEISRNLGEVIYFDYPKKEWAKS